MTTDRPGCLLWCGKCQAGVCKRADEERKIRRGGIILCTTLNPDEPKGEDT